MYPGTSPNTDWRQREPAVSDNLIGSLSSGTRRLQADRRIATSRKTNYDRDFPPANALVPAHSSGQNPRWRLFRPLFGVIRVPGHWQAVIVLLAVRLSHRLSNRGFAGACILRNAMLCTHGSFLNTSHASLPGQAPLDPSHPGRDDSVAVMRMMTLVMSVYFESYGYC